MLSCCGPMWLFSKLWAFVLLWKCHVHIIGCSSFLGANKARPTSTSPWLRATNPFLYKGFRNLCKHVSVLHQSGSALAEGQGRASFLCPFLCHSLHLGKGKTVPARGWAWVHCAIYPFTHDLRWSPFTGYRHVSLNTQFSFLPKPHKSNKVEIKSTSVNSHPFQSKINASALELAIQMYPPEAPQLPLCEVSAYHHEVSAYHSPLIWKRKRK